MPFLSLVLPSLLLAVVSLIFCGKKEKKTPSSETKLTSSQGSATVIAKSSNSTNDRSKQRPPSKTDDEVDAEPKPPLAADLVVDKTQMTAPTPLMTVEAPEPQHHTSDVEDDTIDDAASLRPVKLEQPSDVMVASTKKTNKEMKVDVTVASERTLREVRPPSARKTLRKTVDGGTMTAREKKRSMISVKRGKSVVQPTQEC